jgi:hypothetical protein
MENENENEDVIVNKDIDKNKFDTKKYFEQIWGQYPEKSGKKQAFAHFRASVKTDADWDNIKLALANYLKCDRVASGFVQNGKTWFNNWQDWINPTDTMMHRNGSKKQTSEFETEYIPPERRGKV